MWGDNVNNIRTGSCFSGVGMWELGLKYLGIPHKQQFFIEKDKFASKSYVAIHGDIKNYGDVTKVEGHEVEDIDLFFYSPPCQSFSVAGKGLGIDDERGLLFTDSLRIIKAKKPKICIMENVKGLTNKKHKDFFQYILDSLRCEGYKNYWKLLNTKDYGIPQNRERVFIVSIREDIYNGFEWSETFDSGFRLEDLLEDGVDEKFYISNEKAKKLLDSLSVKSFKRATQFGADLSVNNPKEREIANCITARCDSDIFNFKQSGTGVVECLPCLSPDRENKRQNGRRIKSYGEPMFTLTTQDRHGVVEYSHNKPQRLGDIFDKDNKKRQAGSVWDKKCISPTLDTMQGGHSVPKILEGFKIRKLTPRECWRLQAIKDEDFNKAQEVNSNSRLYMQAGNGVSVNVVIEILEQLKKFGYIEALTKVGAF